MRLDHEPANAWKALNLKEPANKTDQSPSSNETGDVAFEHKQSGAIISVNSVCREYRLESLDELTEDLFMGINKRGPIISRQIELDDEPALESTVDATQRKSQKSADEYPIRIRAVVMRKSGCTFDLMYIARPEYFDALLADFTRFLKGFHAQ